MQVSFKKANKDCVSFMHVNTILVHFLSHKAMKF